MSLRIPCKIPVSGIRPSGLVASRIAAPYDLATAQESEPAMPIHFGAFVLDRETRQLRRGASPQRLRSQAFALLELLVERRPAVVTKQEIRDRLWPETFVSESTLSSLAAQVRRALGSEGASYLRTVHGLGYAFDSEAIEEKPRRGAASIAAHLIWNRRTMVLMQGENVLGRDPDVAVRIEAPGVSRRHARIACVDGRFTLEDLGSKNGTYLHEERVAAPAQLADGDEFRLGQTALVFRVLGENAPTATEA
jgi:DNA-binding winged helix-turn-helix (wHTH) protein